MEIIFKKLEDVKRHIEEQYRSLETASRTQETEIRVFFSKITAKVKERELEVLSSLQKQFEIVHKVLSTHKSEVEEQSNSTKALLKKLEQFSSIVSPYSLLSNLFIMR
jgi:hypothetical protein